MAKCVIYTRVSTTEQANHGFSLQRQKKDCIEFAKKNGYEVAEIFEERGESAKTTDRTELQAMLNYCSLNHKDIDALIVWKSDRLSRNFDDHYALATIFTRLSIKILFATETNDDSASGKFLRNMIKAVNQFENDTKSERTVAGMKQAFIEGRWLWKAPYGYKQNNGDMFIDDEKANIVRRIFEMFSTGIYSQTQIRNILERENIFITPASMFGILRQSVYCGRMYVPSLHPEIVKGCFEPIISEELFDKVQTLLSGVSPMVTPYLRNNAEFPLRQFILCPVCGAPLTASKSTGSKYKKYAYYHCYNKGCRSQARIPKDILETCFTNYLEELRPEGLNMTEFKQLLKTTYNKALESTKAKISKLNRDLEMIQEKKDKLIDMYLAGKLREADYNSKSEKLDSEEQHIKDNLACVDLPKDDFNKCVEYVCNSLENIDKVWLQSDLDTKQRLQKLIFPEGLIYENNGFRTGSNSCLFTKKGAFMAPDFNMVPPSEFESLSTP